MKDIVTVIIVDDHEMSRIGLSTMLETIDYIKVIGTAGNSKQLFTLLRTEEPDIIFMDIDLTGENGIDITRKVLAQHSDIYVVAFTSSDEVSNFSNMIDAGAFGFLLKNVSMQELHKAIDEITNGNMYFSKEFLLIARQLVPSTKVKKAGIKLSEREKEVLRFICLGFSNQEIADELFLSYHTIDAHRRNLLSKTGARNTASMIMISIRDGLIDF